ncbi:two-component system OmpR family sensor kinase [Murinocardiopsis flavida]|uniref:histidine kinase n=1 Tax=Murinocardiopsis flavida TaxID=645275 RepID=A0A2P8DN31_9ACTN|nr:HAMP domain-containing sensor histidine kinase [Murinocardiopsis flavida]PSK98616.1 two-component system OmpR family sensor kinase [Murinocardiopsis flavida]
MQRGRSLRSRLLIGLLAVTGVGLLFTCVVSFLMLRSFITERLDAQVVLAAERAMVRLDNGTPPVGVEAPSPSPYFVVLLSPKTGKVDNVYGDTQREDVVISRINSIPLERLVAYGKSKEIFELGDPDHGVPAHRATVRLRSDAVMVSGVPTDDREAYPWQLVLTQLITAGLLLSGLTFIGRWLIVRGLGPLDRMETTANQISTGSDLADRVPGAEPFSEVGRLGMAINTMLGRIERAFAAQQASEERVRSFAADASHELRTPLTTIRGYAELYRQGAIPDAELPGAIRRIENEAERMSRLVAELLELARLDRSGSLQWDRCDLAAVVRDVVADARALEPGRRLRLDVPDHLEREIDETRFRQILANLLGNVREHTPPGTPATVRLSAGTGPAETVLTVSDDGQGMSSEDQQRAFDRFYRGTRAPGGGSGLGLAIVRAIAEAHGGTVHLVPRNGHEGSGVTVTVRIPARGTDG